MDYATPGKTVHVVRVRATRGGAPLSTQEGKDVVARVKSLMRECGEAWKRHDWTLGAEDYIECKLPTACPTRMYTTHVSLPWPADETPSNKAPPFALVEWRCEAEAGDASTDSFYLHARVLYATGAFYSTPQEANTQGLSKKDREDEMDFVQVAAVRVVSMLYGSDHRARWINGKVELEGISPPATSRWRHEMLGVTGGRDGVHFRRVREEAIGTLKYDKSDRDKTRWDEYEQTRVTFAVVDEQSETRVDKDRELQDHHTDVAIPDPSRYADLLFYLQRA